LGEGLGGAVLGGVGRKESKIVMVKLALLRYKLRKLKGAGGKGVRRGTNRGKRLTVQRQRKGGRILGRKALPVP